MPIRTALIGFGQAGALLHAPLILAEPRLHLARVVTSRAGEVASKVPGALVSATPEAVLANDEIQLIVIATPNQTHAALARDALLAGKHVVVDKPFVVEADEGAELVQLARARGLTLTVFHNRRWGSDYLTAAKVLASGRLGRIKLAELRWDRFRTGLKPGWREVPGDGSGLMSDLAPHLLDQAVALFGLPQALQADCARQRDAALVEDYFELTLHYGQMRAIVSASTLVSAPRPRFGLYGTLGSFVKYGLDPQEATLKAGGTPDVIGYGEEGAATFGTLTTADQVEVIRSERGDWRMFYRGVAASVADGMPPPVDPTDALVVIELMEHARRSARDDRLVRLLSAV